MKNVDSKNPELTPCAVGSPDFCRQVTSAITQATPGIRVTTGSLVEGWGAVVAARPNLLFVEIGLNHKAEQQVRLRSFLSQVRERLGQDVIIAIVMSAPERFYYGGDLLFSEDRELAPSGLVDTMLVVPPGLLPSIPDLRSQIHNVISLCRDELCRRAEGGVPLPALNMPGWAQSLADPKSRELWMKWLPRYASYTNENPLIFGTTGTGKTNLAYALHLLSKRSGQFISITPRDFSSSELVQSELFGSVAGAFTGAVDKWGLVKRAEKGTLFIDELQSIDKDLQGKLITFIENKAYRRVGSSESTTADVRFVFASNVPLHDLMNQDVLRHDFAYRLERVTLDNYSLAERRLDIAAALAYALAKIHRQRPYTQPVTGVTPGSYRLLFGHSWPGNLRQLENSVARLTDQADMQNSQLISEDITAEFLGSRLAGSSTATGPDVVADAASRFFRQSLSGEIGSIQSAVEKISDTIRESALEITGGDIARAAALIDDHSTALKLYASLKNESHRSRT